MMDSYEVPPSKKRARKSGKLWRIKHNKLGGITIIIGITVFAILEYAHLIYYVKGSDEYFWEILISIPVTLVCLGAFSVYYEWYIRENFTLAIRELIGAWDTGVLVLSTHLHAPNRLEILINAHKNVKLMSTTLFKYFDETAGGIERKIKENDVKFQFIIYDPDSHAIVEKAHEETAKAARFKEEIKRVCDDYLGPWVKQFPKNVEVRFCPFNTPFGVTIIDDTEMVLSLNIPGLARAKHETPCLWIKNRYQKDSVFKQYDDSFNAIWKKLNNSYPDSVSDSFI